MPPRTLGAMHMSNNRTYEPQRTCNFEVQIAGLGEQITLSVLSAPAINITNEEITISHGNAKVKFPGQATFEGGELVVVDFIGADIEKQVHEWQRAVYDPQTDKIGWAADYKKNGILTEYSPDGSVTREWKIMGIFPTAVNYGEHTYDGSDKKQISLTLSYDKCVMTRCGEVQNTSLVDRLPSAG